MYGSAKLFIWSGFRENGFVVVFIWTEWHTPVQWPGHINLGHCLTTIPFFPTHPPHMQRRNKETPLDYTYSSRYIEQESHEVRTSSCPKSQEDTSISVSTAECNSVLCSSTFFTVSYGSRVWPARKSISSSSHWMQNPSPNLLLL